jgi:hypothetical protein
MRYQQAVLVVIFVLWCGAPLLGHHYAFYNSIFAAIDQKDLESAKHLFSEGAWKGQASDVSGVDLSKRLKDSKSYSKYETTSLQRQTRVPYVRTAIYLEIVYEEGKESGHFWFLAVGKPSNKDPEAHEILRITNNIIEAEKYLSRKLPSVE